MLATSTLVRRSVLIVPTEDQQAVGNSWRHNADAIALELGEQNRWAARAQLAEAIDAARSGGAEVFVCIDKTLAYADIKAAARPGLKGFILPNP